MPSEQLDFIFDSSADTDVEAENASGTHGSLASNAPASCSHDSQGAPPKVAFGCLDFSSRAEPSAPLPHLLDELAQVWGLPLGERVEITFRPAFPLPAVNGFLELAADPAYPWDAHQPLALRVAGCDFTHRDIERWHVL